MNRRGRITRLAATLLATVVLTTPGWSQPDEARVVEIVASRFRFEPSRIEVDEGERVRLVLRSTDVTHGFAVPELGLSVRIPEGGSRVAVDFVPERPGEFDVICSEYCGAGHDGMSATLVVRPTGSPPPSETDVGELVEEEDFTVVNLPTTLPLARHRFAFRVTHRFDRPLGDGDFDDLLADFLALDGGAQIGLELRFGLLARAQLGAYRTSNRTIQLFGQVDLARQDQGSPVGLSLLPSIEGLDNFQEEYSPSLGVTVSRRIGDRIALYAVPRWVGNTNIGIDPADGDDDTVTLGLGARVRVLRSVALVAEVSPRLWGFDGRRGESGNDFHASFGVEKLLGGHVFQLNFSNDIGTTPAQIARGQRGPEDWFVGFNISRRF